MNKQKGTTLISLLIGLLIAMLCIIAVLSLYRMVVRTGVDSRKAATHDTQMLHALTTTQMLVQNAGFGLDPTIAHAIIADISIAQTNVHALLWRDAEYENGSATCHGIADISSSNSRQLALLKSTNCPSTGSLSTLTWTQDHILAQLADISSDSSNPVQITFSISNIACTPYGAGNINTSHPTVTISATTSTKQNINMTTCLLNI